MFNPLAVTPATGLPFNANIAMSAAFGAPVTAASAMATAALPAPIAQMPAELASSSGLAQTPQFAAAPAAPLWRTAVPVVAGVLGVSPVLHADEVSAAGGAAIPEMVQETAMTLAEGLIGIPWQSWGEFGAIFGTAYFAHHVIGKRITKLESLSGDRFSRDNLAAGGLRWVRRFIWGGATLLGLNVLGVDYQNIAIEVGIVVAVIGMGLRNAISNLVNYWALVARGQLDIDNYVSVKGVGGYVRKISPSGVVLETTDKNGIKSFITIPCATYIAEISRETVVKDDAIKSIRAGHYVSIDGKICGRVAVRNDKSIGIEVELPDGTQSIKYVEMHELSHNSFKNYGFNPPRLPGGVGVGSNIVLDGKRGEVQSYNAQFVYLKDEEGQMMHRIPRTKFAGTWSYIDISTRKFADDEVEPLVFPPLYPPETGEFIELRKPAEIGPVNPGVGARAGSFADLESIAGMKSANMVEISPDKFPAGEKLIRLNAAGDGFEEVPENMARLAFLLKKGKMTAQIYAPYEFDAADGSTKKLSMGNMDDHDLLMRYFATLESLRSKYGLADELIVAVQPPYEPLNEDFEGIVARHELAEVTGHTQIADDKKREIEERYLQNGNSFLVGLGRTIKEKGWKIKVGVENQANSTDEFWSLGNKMSDFEMLMHGTSDAIQLTFNLGHSLLMRGSNGELRPRSPIYFARQSGRYIVSFNVPQNFRPKPNNGGDLAPGMEVLHRYYLMRAALEGTSTVLDVDMADGQQAAVNRNMADIRGRIAEMQKAGRP